MYSILFSDLALKQIKKVPLEIRKRIINFLERSRIRPHSFVKKLVGNNFFRLRVGDYRVIVDIQNDKMIVYVIELGHRKNIYK